MAPDSLLPHTLARETRDARYDHMILAEVIDNMDPEKHDRVKVFAPGYLEPESQWAFPLGAMFGVKNGCHWIPEKGANVCIFLNQGHTDHPYYMAGPWGAPAGQSDQPDETDQGDPDVVVIRWRNFFFKINGKPGNEKITVKDRTSTTQLEIIRASGNFERVIAGPMGDEIATVKRHKVTTLQTGNETRTLTAGSRTTTIAQNDTKTVTGTDTETVGVKSKTVVGAETVMIGQAKSEMIGMAWTVLVGLIATITATLSVIISAGLNVAITAGGAVTIVGAGTTIQSTGPAFNIASGLLTNNFLGGIFETIVGTVTKSITGAYTLTMVVGIYKIIGADIQFGAGTPKKLLNEALIAYLNDHTHNTPAGESDKPTQQIVDPIATPPDVDKTTLLTANVKAS